MRETLHIIQTERLHVFEQLRLEEAILRGSNLNLCLINRGSPRSIIMGISGRPELLLDIPKVQQDHIPVIQRFSGGGTVIADEDTLFITFIFAKSSLPIHPFPEPILRWSADLYARSWQIPHFHLIENDYAIGNRKCGGNAQYIQKDRWLHHTTFLWDYDPANMDYLLLPAKRPHYRASRSHAEFLCPLKPYFPSLTHLIDPFLQELGAHFTLQHTTPEKLQWAPHRQSLHWVNLSC